MSFDRFLRECEDEIGGCCYSVTLKSEVVVLHIHKSIAELVVFDREGKIRTKVIDETSFDGHVRFRCFDMIHSLRVQHTHTHTYRKIKWVSIVILRSLRDNSFFKR
jgi:hypothetical protein